MNIEKYAQILKEVLMWEYLNLFFKGSKCAAAIFSHPENAKKNEIEAFRNLTQWEALNLVGNQKWEMVTTYRYVESGYPFFEFYFKRKLDGPEFA